MQVSDNPYLNAVATTLIRNLAGLYTLEVSPLAREFLNSPSLTESPDDAGLIALLYCFLCSTLKNIVDTCR